MFHGTQFPKETLLSMERKKWTARENVTEAYQKFKDKRKWQLGLRRYILEKNPSQAYAPYFGLGIDDFRQWIEIQFTDELSWENFGTAWQFEHIIPLSYFDFNSEEDLRLCWNFINIGIEPTVTDRKKIDLLTAMPYFEFLYARTGYGYCLKMVEKLNSVQSQDIVGTAHIEAFLRTNKQKIDEMKSFDASDFFNLNKGTPFGDILMEKAIFKKFS
jgi:hypothetical protein